MTTTSTKIDVAVRVRPLLEHEKNAGLRQTYLKTALGSNEVRLYEPDGKNNKVFTFDKVCGNNCAQEEFYETVEIPKYIDHVLEGYNATVFVYGQTGAGKTYTMEGMEYDLSPTRSVHQKQNKILGVKDAGIIPRVIRELFNKIPNMARKYNRNYNVYCSFAELYNEKIFDLLNPDQLNRISPMSPGLKLRWHKKDQFIVENLYVFACSSPEELEFLFQMGVKNKTMASHKLNSSSSRSHCIFEIKVEFADAANPDDVIVSKLALVDLAGSERTAVVSSDGRMAKEAIEINKSLFTLRQVINAIYESQHKGITGDFHVPYRESKLTSLLKQSIGGNSYCLMIACLSPSDESFEENVSTLGYATKAKKIQNEPVRNDDPKWELIQSLKAENADLIQKLNDANKQILFLTQSLQKQTKLAKPETPKSPSRFGTVSLNLDTSSLRIPLITDTTQGEMPPEAFHISEHLTQQLVVAINQIRDLLEVIKKERDRNERLTLKLDQNENILSTLMHENQELRDQLPNSEGLPPNRSVLSQYQQTNRAHSNSISSQGSAQQYKLLAPSPLYPSSSEKELPRNIGAYDTSGYKQAIPILSSMPKNAYDGRHSPCSGQSGYSGSTRTASTPEPSQADTYYKSTNASSRNTSYRTTRDLMGTPTDLRPDIREKSGFEYGGWTTAQVYPGVVSKEYYEGRSRDKSQERSKERSTTPGGRPKQISGGNRDFGGGVKTPVKDYEKREW